MPRQDGRLRLPCFRDPCRQNCRPAPDDSSPGEEPGWVGTDFATRPIAHYTPQAPYFSLIPLLQISLCFVVLFCAYVGFIRPHVVASPDEFRQDFRERFDAVRPSAVWRSPTAGPAR